MPRNNGKPEDKKNALSPANEQIREARATLLLSLKPRVEQLYRGDLDATDILKLLQDVLAANMFDARASASNQAVAGLLKVTTDGAHFLDDMRQLKESVDEALKAAGGRS